jgi:hypothetical protein
MFGMAPRAIFAGRVRRNPDRMHALSLSKARFDLSMAINAL